jgi:hypothetical protein
MNLRFLHILALGVLAQLLFMRMVVRPEVTTKWAVPVFHVVFALLVLYAAYGAWNSPYPNKKAGYIFSVVIVAFALYFFV